MTFKFGDQVLAKKDEHGAVKVVMQPPESAVYISKVGWKHFNLQREVTDIRTILRALAEGKRVEITDQPITEESSDGK